MTTYRLNPETGKILCYICGKNDLPDDWSFVAWCDECLEERKQTGESPREFIDRKQSEGAAP